MSVGSAWLLVLLRADLSCDIDCVGPDPTGWYALGGILIVAGTLLTARIERIAR